MFCRCKLECAPKSVRLFSIPAASTSKTLPLNKKEDGTMKALRADAEVMRGSFKNGSKSMRRLRAGWSIQVLSPDYLSSRMPSQSKSYSTKTPEGSPQDPDEPESLFNSSQSAWDHVFDNIDDLPPLDTVLSSAPRIRKTHDSYSPPSKARRQSMTTREIDAFNNMFNMIFSAVTQQRDGRPGGKGAISKQNEDMRQDPLSGAGIGSGPDGSSRMGDLFGKLRRHSKKFRWSAVEDAELERKKADMELCDTDYQLLEWATREVFEESARYEEAARQAVTRSEAALKSAETSISTNADADKESTGAASPLPLQPPAYPYLLAELIRTFRDKFRDPHLALSIFSYARSRSIASYVFGCTTPAYNELLRTRWMCFRDLRGVADALAEMRVNGIAPDGRTRALVEELRREVGARTVWQEERSLGTGEVLDMLNRIEQLVVKDEGNMSKSKSRRWNSRSEQWKQDGRPSQDDEWKFGNWELKEKKRSNHKELPRPSAEEYPDLAFV